MHASALFVSLFWNDSFFDARIVSFSWTLTLVEFGRWLLKNFIPGNDCTLSLFGTDFLTWTDFLVFLGNPKSCKGSLLVHICKLNVGDRNGIKLQISRAWTHSENKFQPGVLSDYTVKWPIWTCNSVKKPPSRRIAGKGPQNTNSPIWTELLCSSFFLLSLLSKSCDSFPV